MAKLLTPHEYKLALEQKVSELAIQAQTARNAFDIMQQHEHEEYWVHFIHLVELTRRLAQEILDMEHGHA